MDQSTLFLNNGFNNFKYKTKTYNTFKSIDNLVLIVYSIYIKNNNFPLLYDYLLSVNLSLKNLQYVCKFYKINNIKFRIYIDDSIISLLNKDYKYIFDEKYMDDIDETEYDLLKDDIKLLQEGLHLQCKELYNTLKESPDVQVIEFELLDTEANIEVNKEANKETNKGNKYIAIGRFFRLLPLLDDINFFISRDADSILPLVEIMSILKFISSDKKIYLSSFGYPLQFIFSKSKNINQNVKIKNCDSKSYSEWLKKYDNYFNIKTKYDILAGLVGFNVKTCNITYDDINQSIDKMLKFNVDSEIPLDCFDELFLRDVTLKYNIIDCTTNMNNLLYHENVFYSTENSEFKSTWDNTHEIFPFKRSRNCLPLNEIIDDTELNKFFKYIYSLFDNEELYNDEELYNIQSIIDKFKK